MIRTKSINKYYDKGRRNENHVVNDVSIELPDTGLVCILGESGSGKTTLLNCIGKLDTFGSGEIEIAGKSYTGSVGQSAERVRNERFAYVFQNYFLIKDQTVFDNLMLALNLYDIPYDEKVARIDYVLNALDIKRYRKRKVSMLSGGQQQRVAIARAIIKSPEVIFADEPTGNLDEENTVRVMNILKRISKNCLVLLATHEKRIAEFYADRIINVSDGKIVSDVKPEAQESLARFDDHDIYLDEYKLDALRSDDFAVDYYSRGGEPIRISIVHEGGNLYLTVPEGLRIERVGADSSVKIKEGSRPKYDHAAAEKQEFSLSKPKARNGSTLSMKRIFSMAAGSVTSRGSKLAVPFIAMLLTAVICMFAVTDYLTIAQLDPTDFIKTDQRVLNIEVQRYGFDNDVDNSGDQPMKVSRVPEIIAALDASGVDYILFPTVTQGTSFSVEGFYQINELSDRVKDFSFVPLDYLDPAYLIMGSMPKNCTEVVVDRWVLDKFLERKTPTAQAMVNIENFLGRKLHLDARKGRDVTIVGICDTGAPAVYIDYGMGITLCRLGKNVTSVEMLNANGPYIEGLYEIDNMEETGADQLGLSSGASGGARGMSLGYNNGVNGGSDPGAAQEWFDEDGYVLAFLKSAYQNMPADSYRPEVSVDLYGYAAEQFPADYAVSKAAFHEWATNLAADMNTFTVYTYDKDAVKDVLENGLDEKLAKSVQLVISDEFNTNLAVYRYSRNTKLYTRVLVIGAIIGISFVVLYVTMRGAAIQRLREIAVYRLLGIKKRSIISMFAIQILLMSLISTLIGTLATAGVLHLLSQVKTMNYDFTVTWASVLSTIVGLFAVNLVTGTLPVARLINIPPAQLSAKYDL